MDIQTTNIPIGYKSLETRKDSGAHYTPANLSWFVASKIASQIDFDKMTSLKILDPAIGDGQLMIALLKELLSRNGKIKLEIHGFDTDKNALKTATDRITSIYPNIPLFMNNEDFLDYAIKNGRNDLFNQNSDRYDIIIANPPYVRTQVLGTVYAKKIAKLFNLSGRIDLYHAFLLGISMILKPGGISGIITSNRFMTTKSGACVRSAIIQKFNIVHIWDLGDTNLFEAAVLPSVLLLRKKTGDKNFNIAKFTSVYSTSTDDTNHEADSIIDALDFSGVIKIKSGEKFKVKTGHLEHGHQDTGIWRISTDQSNSILSKINQNTHFTFKDIGKIKVGIKTTADKVFIRSDWTTLPTNEQPELLFPIITHHIANRYKTIESSNTILVLYPHVVINGKRETVNLKDFPNTATYLNKHKPILEARKYVTSAGRKWFEIWVPQNPDAWGKPKLVFRDISEKPTFWIDLEGRIVNGDCYWITCDNPKNQELLWLALAIGNSKFIEWFYDNSFNNKLYSGRRRFMTQYVENFPLPNPETQNSKKIIRLAKTAYEENDLEKLKVIEYELNDLVWNAFDLSIEEITR